jgi:hypothetical protein
MNMNLTVDSSDIKVAQRLLSLLDYGVLDDNGMLDDKTKKAITLARADLGLPPGESVDNELLTALSNEHATRGLRKMLITASVASIALAGLGFLAYRKWGA